MVAATSVTLVVVGWSEEVAHVCGCTQDSQNTLSAKPRLPCTLCQGAAMRMLSHSKMRGSGGGSAGDPGGIRIRSGGSGAHYDSLKMGDPDRELLLNKYYT